MRENFNTVYRRPLSTPARIIRATLFSIGVGGIGAGVPMTYLSHYAIVNGNVNIANAEEQYGGGPDCDGYTVNSAGTAIQPVTQRPVTPQQEWKASSPGGACYSYGDGISGSFPNIHEDQLEQTIFSNFLIGSIGILTVGGTLAAIDASRRKEVVPSTEAANFVL